MGSRERVRDFAASLSREIAREAVDIASLALNVAAADIRAPTRERARAAFARQVAMYLAHVIGQLTTVDIAAHFARDRSTVSHACASIEERRESPLFDKQFEVLEAEMRARMEFLISRFEREEFALSEGGPAMLMPRRPRGRG